MDILALSTDSYGVCVSSCRLTHKNAPVALSIAYGDNCDGSDRTNDRVFEHLTTITNEETVSYRTPYAQYRLCVVAYCQDDTDTCAFGIKGTMKPSGTDVPLFIIIGAICLGGGLLMGAAWMALQSRRRKKARQNDVEESAV